MAKIPVPVVKRRELFLFISFQGMRSPTENAQLTPMTQKASFSFKKRLPRFRNSETIRAVMEVAPLPSNAALLGADRWLTRRHIFFAASFRRLMASSYDRREQIGRI
jgi:hypothetical protein